MKKLVCLCVSISPDIYSRDMFLVPYYIGKKGGYEVSFLYHGKKGEVPFVKNEVHMIPLFYPGNYDCFSFLGEWYFMVYTLLHARKIDFMVRFHFSYQTILLAILYKVINPKGIFLIKCDGYGLWYSLCRSNSLFPGLNYRNPKNPIVKLKNRVLRWFLNIGATVADLVTVETPEVRDYLKEQNAFRKNPDKLIYMLNGIDEEAIRNFGIKDLSFEQKNNWIISVGRHGNWQKNTAMFLNALDGIDLKDWEVFFVGPIEKGFEKEIDSFYNQNPLLKNKVHFVGGIYDQAKLWDYYNKAKVFVHTAVYESYGLVLGEAYRFGNYILSTDVGIASEFINRGYGYLLKQNDSDGLRVQLERIIQGELDLSYLFNHIERKSISWEKEVGKLHL